MGNIISGTLSGATQVLDMNMSNICTEASEVLQFAGWILTFFKIAIPLLIIGLGMFDFGKAVVASKDDEIKKSAKTLMYRAVAGVVIFFVPTLVLWLFGTVQGFSDAQKKTDFDVCERCILSPWKC